MYCVTKNLSCASRRPQNKSSCNNAFPLRDTVQYQTDVPSQSSEWLDYMQIDVSTYIVSRLGCSKPRSEPRRAGSADTSIPVGRVCGNTTFWITEMAKGEQPISHPRLYIFETHSKRCWVAHQKLYTCSTLYEGTSGSSFFQSWKAVTEAIKTHTKIWTLVVSWYDAKTANCKCIPTMLFRSSWPLIFNQSQPLLRSYKRYHNHDISDSSFLARSFLYLVARLST